MKQTPNCPSFQWCGVNILQQFSIFQKGSALLLSEELLILSFPSPDYYTITRSNLIIMSVNVQIYPPLSYPDDEEGRKDLTSYDILET